MSRKQNFKRDLVSASRNPGMKAPQYKKVIVFVGFSLFILSSFSLMRNLKNKTL